MNYPFNFVWVREEIEQIPNVKDKRKAKKAAFKLRNFPPMTK